MVSIDQLAGMIMRIAGKHLGLKHVPGPLGVRGRNSDNTLIQEKLGWKPTASLREGLAQTYQWVAEQVEKVRDLRKRRDNAAVEKALEAVRVAARNGENLVPPCLAAVKVYATHGELCYAMRDVFGVHTPDSQLGGV